MKTFTIVKKILKRPCDAFVLTRYFTMWALCTHIMLRKSNALDKKLLAQIVSIGGFYFTFISPRALNLPLTKHSYTLSGIELMLIDIVTHHLPYLYERKKREKYTTQAKINTMLLLGAYLCVNDICKVYNIRKKDLLYIGAANVLALL